MNTAAALTVIWMRTRRLGLKNAIKDACHAGASIS